jgi:hypothetical protein
MRLAFAIALMLAAAALPCRAGITIDDWNNDSLSSPTGTVDIDVEGVSSRTATISNSTTLESVAVTLTSAGWGDLNAVNGDELAVDVANINDSATYFDGQSAIAESLTLQFDKTVTITSLAFNNINWDPFAGDYIYEFVRVFIGGTHTYTLFSESAITSHPGYTGATGPIQGSAGDDFNGLSWNIPASTVVELRFGADPLSFSIQQGYRLDNVSFSVAAVPEASAFAFGGAACGLAVAWTWRRRRGLVA